MLKIRRSRDSLIFNMGIPIPVKDSLNIETDPYYLYNENLKMPSLYWIKALAITSWQSSHPQAPQADIPLICGLAQLLSYDILD